jgi:hypothetical protein
MRATTHSRIDFFPSLTKRNRPYLSCLPRCLTQATLVDVPSTCFDHANDAVIHSPIGHLLMQPRYVDRISFMNASYAFMHYVASFYVGYDFPITLSSALPADIVCRFEPLRTSFVTSMRPSEDCCESYL